MKKECPQCEKLNTMCYACRDRYSRLYGYGPYRKSKPVQKAGEMKKAIKPKMPKLIDARCVSEEYDDHGGGAFCVEVVDFCAYDAKTVRRLIKFLIKAEKWIAIKELYR